MASSEYSPLQWPCPNCNKCCSTFLRGTCSHDVCSSCISNLASLVEQTELIEVRCPIDRCRHGTFHVKRVKVSADVASSIGKVKSDQKIKREDMIDLCTTDDEDDNGLDRKPAAKRKIKQEVKKEQTNASPKSDTSIKKEKSPKPTTSTHRSKKSKIVSPLRKKTSNLKPLFNNGDKVTVAWWHPKLDPNQEGDPKGWYPGTIVSYKNIGTSEYGPTRTYHIRYDDGDELENIQDYWVFSRKDYALSMRSQPNIGVKKRRDKQSYDMWAKKVGWYEINVSGTKKLFSFLSDAMKAYDDHVVQRDGKQTKKSHLNLPGNYPSLFPEEGKVKVEVKHELKGEETDDERFSGGEEESPKSPKSKRRRVEGEFMSRPIPRLDRQDKLRRKGDFWSIVADPIDFSRRAFMNNPLFHLNPGIDGTVKHQNLWFSPFLREGLASPGFCRVPYSIASEVSTSSYEQIRYDINDECYYGEGIHSARQVALWLKDATVGSFIIMRHEFQSSPLLTGKQLLTAWDIASYETKKKVTDSIVGKLGALHGQRIVCEGRLNFDYDMRRGTEEGPWVDGIPFDGRDVWGFTLVCDDSFENIWRVDPLSFVNLGPDHRPRCWPWSDSNVLPFKRLGRGNDAPLRGPGPNGAISAHTCIGPFGCSGKNHPHSYQAQAA